MMWGSYDPIESGPSDPKKWGLYGRSVKNMHIFGPKMGPGGRPEARRATQSTQKSCLFGVPP